MDNWSSFARNIALTKYSHKDSSGKPLETWNDIASRVVGAVVGDWHSPYYEPLLQAVSDRKFLPGGRYLYASGRPYHQVNNCFQYRAEDSREGWADLNRKATMALMSGGGIGVDYSNIRGEGEPIKKTGGFCSGPLSLMQMINEVGRHVMQGGSRRSAIWAGLRWNHPDIFKFIHLKDWPEWLIKQKSLDFNTPAVMDMTNISVILDREFFDAFEAGDTLARNVYYETCYQMFKKSEPGFSINYENPNESLRNACTEIVSEDDSDVCNLGSINVARIKSLSEFERITRLGTYFLICGTLYSDVPHEEVRIVREKNRRIGLGLMGIHEWFLQRGYQYGTIPEEFRKWLERYRDVSDRAAEEFADNFRVSRPVGRRAIAPTGTISICAETTSGIEPIFCAAYRRRYLKGKTWHYEYVVDPTAKRLIEETKINPEGIEDAYSLSRTTEGFERRISFQYEIQKYVDHAISSTINLKKWGSPSNDPVNAKAKADILYKYLPGLRGITVYADGSRGGQPLEAVQLATAMRHKDRVFEEATDICEITKNGICSA